MQIEGRDLSLDLVYGRARVGGESHDLTTMEVRALAYLFEHSERWVSKEELLVRVWGYSHKVQSRTVATTINRLRQKLEPQPAAPRYLMSSADGYRLELPTARSPALPLPYRDDAFVGRVREIKWLDRAFGAGRRAVCIVGTGGIGKTRLAEEYARRELHEGRSVLFADAVPCATTDDLFGGVAAELDIRGGGASLVTRVAMALTSRRTDLLVLDNLEHLPADVAPAIERLVDSAPTLRVLVTSQRPIPLSGVGMLELGPLSADDAETLFLVRGYDHRSEPAPEPGDRAVQALLQELQGVPLALELAAGWTDLLAADEIRERLAASDLDRRQPGPDRHASLVRALAAAWRGLASAQRSALHQATVFVGGFTPRGAEDVIQAGGEPTLGLLQQLHARSLVHRNPGSRRLRMLLPVRVLVRERLGPPPEETRQRHVAWAIANGNRLLDAYGGREPGRARAQLEGERGNLVAAFEDAMDRRDHSAATQVARVIARHDQAALRPGPHGLLMRLSAQDLEPEDRARVLVGLAMHEEIDGSAEAEVQLAQQAMALTHPGSLTWSEAGVRQVVALGFLNRIDESAALARQVAAVGDAHGHSAMARMAQSQLGDAHRQKGALEEALRTFEENIDAAAEAGMDRQRLLDQIKLGDALAWAARPDDAIALLDEAIAATEAQHLEELLAVALWKRGRIRAEQGDISAGMADLERAQELAGLIGSRRLRGSILWRLSILALDAAPHAEVQRWLDAAIALTDDDATRFSTDLTAALLQLDSGNVDGGIAALQRMLETPLGAEPTVHRSTVLFYLAMGHGLAGDCERARARGAEVYAGWEHSSLPQILLDTAALVAVLHPQDPGALAQVEAAYRPTLAWAAEQRAAARRAHGTASPPDMALLAHSAARCFNVRTLLRIVEAVGADA